MSKIFVIGVGGTGIKTLIHVKKALTDPEKSGRLPEDVRLLGIDTCLKAEKVEDIGLWGGAFSRNGSKTDVELDNDEYIPLTGDMRDWVKGTNAVTTQLHYRWFDRRYFSHPANNALLNVTAGAGMYRQIGRLAFYNNVSGQNSPLYAAIKRNLEELAGGGGELNVLVCGSLAGGTGAGIFADVGSLVRKIFDAEIGTSGAALQLHGLFALPNAFKGTGAVSTRVNEMKPRAFAAMLEIERFLVMSNISGGSLAQYIPETNDAVLSGRLGNGAVIYVML